MAGAFLCLEGLDGTGKSTQIRLLTQWLDDHGFPYVQCRDPGHTTVGEQLRNILLDPQTCVCMTCEMLLYMAARAQMVHEVIRPALEAGKVVVCDRFLMSTIVYQGHGGGLEPEQIRLVGALATEGLMPDWTAVLDLDPHQAAKRRVGAADRIESRSVEFQQQVRQGYLAEVRRDPQRATLIDASVSPEQVHQQILTEVRRVLDAAGRS